jgi:hypothetical protein
VIRLVLAVAALMIVERMLLVRAQYKEQHCQPSDMASKLEGRSSETQDRDNLLREGDIVLRGCDTWSGWLGYNQCGRGEASAPRE